MSSELAADIPSTAALTGTALLLSVVFGGGLALWATHTRMGWLKSLLLSLRNALTSTVTIAGVLVGQLLAGTVVVETVFSRAGLGTLTATAVSNSDIPVVQGMVVLGAVVFVSINLIVDLIYPLLDPRVVLTGRSWLAV